WVRVAPLGDKIYVDLADDEWRAIEIDVAGWRVVNGPAVRFRRPRGMQWLPEPSRGGSVGQLRSLLNLSEPDFTLVIGWMLMALRGLGPFPVLVVAGEQGSAKSTTSA